MIKCLVTGGAGFVGSHVVDALLEQGHQVTVLDNLSTGDVENIDDRAIFINGDIRDYQPTKEYDVIFHLASLARIQPSIENPKESHDVNLTGTLNVLQWATQMQAKVIFSSSSSIYSDKALPQKETSPVDVKNPYTAQKWMCEQYLELFNKLYGLDYVILRYFNVFGERQILDGAYAAVVGIFLYQKIEKGVLTLSGDGKQRRDFTYVKDVARANLMAMDWPKGAYNIGTAKNYSMNQLAKKIGGKINYYPRPDGEVEKTLADNRKAKRMGWKPSVNIMEWLDETKP